MMSEPSENVTPDTVANITHARDLSTRKWEDRMVPYANIGALLTERAIATPEKDFLTYYDDNGLAAAYTYIEFYDAARRVAALMAGPLDLQTGDRVATLMVNDARTALIYFGAWLLGVTVVPINCGEDDERVAYILANSEAKAAFALDKEAERLEKLRAEAPLLRQCVQVAPRVPVPLSPNSLPNEGIAGATLPGFLDFETALTSQMPLTALPNVPLDAECLLVYTSGTTGAPKGVVLQQYNLLVDAHSIAEWHGFGPNDRAMCVLPIHHVNGTVVTLMTPLTCGGSVVLNRRFHVLNFWRTLAEEGCTYVSVVPTVLAFLCERPADLTQLDLTRFRHIICGAGPLTVELARRFHETFRVRVVHGYGLSETTCYSCFLPIDLDEPTHQHWMTECGFPSIGCPISANEMAIHDDKGNPLPEDARGEIVIRGHNVMKYYFQRPDANRETFAFGWFRSGDEGFYRIGADGRPYFFITGRIKELIIRGGINYSPFDMDEVLNAIPGVRAAMAVGFENSFYGEEVGAYVQLQEGATVTADDILRYCRERLPFTKCPKVVIFGDTFPVTSTGKYQRNRLKPLFAEWKETQFRP